MTDREAVARYLAAHLPDGDQVPRGIRGIAQGAIDAGIDVAKCRRFCAVLDTPNGTKRKARP